MLSYSSEFHRWNVHWHGKKTGRGRDILPQQYCRLRLLKVHNFHCLFHDKWKETGDGFGENKVLKLSSSPPHLTRSLKQYPWVLQCRRKGKIVISGWQLKPQILGDKFPLSWSLKPINCDSFHPFWCWFATETIRKWKLLWPDSILCVGEQTLGNILTSAPDPPLLHHWTEAGITTESVSYNLCIHLPPVTLERVFVIENKALSELTQ